MTATDEVVDITADLSSARMCSCGHPAGRHGNDGACRHRSRDRDGFDCTCRNLDPVYSAPQVVALAGITYRQLDWWCRTGRLTETANGSGTMRHFTADELDVARLVGQLIEHGLTVPAAFPIARQVVTDGRYEACVADIYQLSITVRDTQPTEETP